MQIYLTLRNVYGVPKIYPVCDTSKKLALLADSKTFNIKQLKIIASLGYAITQVTDTGLNIVGLDQLISKMH